GAGWLRVLWNPPLDHRGRVSPDVPRRRSGHGGRGTAGGRVACLPTYRGHSLLHERGSAQGRSLRVSLVSPQWRHRLGVQGRESDEWPGVEWHLDLHYWTSPTVSGRHLVG